MDWDSDLIKFNSIRKIVLCFKHSLEILNDIKLEHDKRLSELYKSLEDLEIFVKDKTGFDLEFCHLSNHVDFLSDEKIALLRKKILDYGNNLKREMENI